MKNRFKIQFANNPLPKEMWAIGHYWKLAGKKQITYEASGSSDDMKETYLILSPTENEAERYINNMNKQDWFKNRNNQPIKINTTLKKWKSRYVPLEYAFNKLYQ